MERKINWNSNMHDEIELVYEKANNNEDIAAMLMDLEAMAIQEAEENCGILKINGTGITHEMFLKMNEQDKGMVMYYLSAVGLQDFDILMSEGKIIVTLSPQIQDVLGCTMFSILNRLEKLDGSFNLRFPKAKLELRVPLGAKKGLMKCEMLIMRLYPWLSINETSTETISNTINTQERPENNSSILKEQINNSFNKNNDTYPSHPEEVIHKKCDSDYNSSEDEAAKALSDLEAALDLFAKSNQNDITALKMIISSLLKVPMFFPVEIDFDTMLDNIDPTKLKEGDIIQPNKDVRMKILTFNLTGTDVIPMFTSLEEAHKGPSASMMQYYPQDFIPLLAKMNNNMTALINPFSDTRFELNTTIINKFLVPVFKDQSVSDNKLNNSVQHDDLIGMVIDGKYKIIKEIGRNNLTRTFLAFDEQTNETFAVESYDKQSKSEDYSNIIINETLTITKLRHPGIPRIINITGNRRYLFIIKEYVEGQTLDNIIRDFGPQPPANVINCIMQLCDILYYLHTLTPPHIHRDIKPANVILQPNGYVKIIDFGIMRTYKKGKPADTTILGTCGYAAPEQYGANQTDARSDIYALGVTMYRLLTGIDPKNKNFVYPPLCQVNPSMHKGLEYIIDKCLKFNPDERYQTCIELRNDLNNYQQLPPKKGIFSKLFGNK